MMDPQSIQMIKFEGPEKKLEIILKGPIADLRNNADGKWDRVLAAVGAKILNRVGTEEMDAYLLSESSLFVWNDGILLITCGQTRLIEALDEILAFVDRDLVAYVFYERKNLMFPQYQPSNFEADVARLDACFPGKSYRLGPANHDHLHVFYYWAGSPPPENDATLQILMNNLHPDVMETFRARAADTPARVARRSGIGALFPAADIDAHVFDPYGYSLNGVRPDGYYTVHVTPQPIGSYASFETNIIDADYGSVMADVLGIFRPGKFSLALSTTLREDCFRLHATGIRVPPDYRMTEKSMYEFDCGYAVTFSNYVDTEAP